MKTTITSSIVCLLLFGCAQKPHVPTARFVNAPPVRAVNDERNSPQPAERDESVVLYQFDGSVYRPLIRPLELHRPQRAHGINALDEVPDSTWFTNRIGVRDLSLDEVRRGPNVVGNPEDHLPWTIHSSKIEGESIGFFISDARGEKFLIKFDRAGYPETETATHVIVGRFFWAFGYNVPDDYIAQVRVQDLLIAHDATKKDKAGKKVIFSRDDLEKALLNVERTDGKVRVMASHILPGKPIGGYPSEGTRADDPNDLIPHQLRRDLRGSEALYAWLDHADAKEQNTLDVWVSAPDNPNRHFVKHYQLDFGKALGGLALFAHDPRRGIEYSFDAPAMWGSFVTLGFRPRRFESRRPAPFRGVAVFDTKHYNPAKWHPESPAYLPFLTADRIDWFWAGKILMRFTPDQIRAIVETGELSNPLSVTYLTNTLISRQRRTAAYAFAYVSPLDNFKVDDRAAVCFDDLALLYKLSDTPTRYLVRSLDRHGRQLGSSRSYDAKSGNTCTSSVDVSTDADGYTMVEIETRRAERGLTVYVHMARDPQTHAWRVIGIYRK